MKGQTTRPGPGETIAARCGTYGLDLSARLRAGAYNQHVAPAHRLPDFDDPDAEVVLIGNTRALWPVFCDALRADPGLANADHPIDQYVEQVIGQACAAIDAETQVRFAHRAEPAHISFQSLAEVAGLAWRSPASLSVHPVYGPWIALRAAVVLDHTGPPTDPFTPRPCDHCEHACAAQFARTQADKAATWEDWLAVRDSCPAGRVYRYSDRQIRYHYTRSRRLLAGLVDG